MIQKQNCGELAEKLKKVQTLNTDFNLKAGKAVSLDTSREWSEEEKALLAEAVKVGEEIEKLILELDTITFETTVTVTYVCKINKKKETSETITIDFEKKLEYSVTFYKNRHIDLPDNFREVMTDIWNRNVDIIKKTIEEQGFDEVILTPGNLSVPDVHAKMSEGYFATLEGVQFKKSGAFESVVEITNKPRIVLIHKNNARDVSQRLELNKTRNIKASDFIESGQNLTLTDYLIFQRQYFEENNKHLDYPNCVWLPGSVVKNSDANVEFRMVYARWVVDNIDIGRLNVGSEEFNQSYPHVGCRLSQRFV